MSQMHENDKGGKDVNENTKVPKNSEVEKELIDEMMNICADKIVKKAVDTPYNLRSRKKQVVSHSKEANESGDKVNKTVNIDKQCDILTAGEGKVLHNGLDKECHNVVNDAPIIKGSPSVKQVKVAESNNDTFIGNKEEIPWYGNAVHLLLQDLKTRVSSLTKLVSDFDLSESQMLCGELLLKQMNETAEMTQVMMKLLNQDDFCQKNLNLNHSLSLLLRNLERLLHLEVVFSHMITSEVDRTPVFGTVSSQKEDEEKNTANRLFFFVLGLCVPFLAFMYMYW
jgi:hypothetical protein